MLLLYESSASFNIRVKKKYLSEYLEKCHPKTFYFIFSNDSSYSPVTPSIFGKKNIYGIWSIKMKVYLKAFGFWDVTNAGGEP